MQTRFTLLNTLPKGSVGAELGVFRGGYSAEVLRIVEPQKLHLIDEWPDKRMQMGGQPYWGTDNYRYVLERFAAQIAEGIVEVHRAESTVAAKSFPDEYLDWIYIDAGHRYEEVSSDLAAWRPKVKRWGLVMGHDYCTPPGENFGIIQAVSEAVDRGELELLGITGELKYPSFIARRLA